MSKSGGVTCSNTYLFVKVSMSCIKSAFCRKERDSIAGAAVFIW